TPANSNTVEQQLNANNTSDRENNNGTANFNYRFKDTVGHVFYLDVDFGAYMNNNTTNQPNSYLDVSTGNELYANNYRMITPSNIKIFTIKADYEQNFWKGKLGIGGKFSNVETDNTFNFYNVFQNYDTLNTDRSNQFNYTENINAAYLNFNRKWTDKWS